MSADTVTFMARKGELVRVMTPAEERAIMGALKAYGALVRSILGRKPVRKPSE